jgi:hypothetical protein
METGFLVLVIPVPGLDPGINPGIAPTGGVRFDPRIKSGDDDEGPVRPAKCVSGHALVLMPLGTSSAMTVRRRSMFPITVKAWPFDATGVEAT